MHGKPLVIDYVMYSMALYCSFDMQGTFILVSGIHTFAFGDYFLPIIIIIASFLKNWALKQVFRGHFGPQVKLSG